ncbi:hypothetical protein CCACVL1_21967, partial [Corchorus capsularis]
ERQLPPYISGFVHSWPITTPTSSKPPFSTWDSDFQAP